MIDLCIDARMSHHSGIGTYIRQIVPLLSGFRIALLVDRLDQDWCRGFEQIRFSAPIYSIQEQILYPFVIPKCDLFWSPQYNIPLLPIRAKKRVVTVHDACHLVYGGWKEKAYARRVMKRALHQSDEVVTVSEFSGKEIQRFFGERAVHVIPIAANRGQFKRQPDSEEIRKKYQLPKRYVLFVGNQKPHKNIEGLKAAFLRLQVPDLGLVTVGNGTERGKVLDEELPFLYSMAEVFVFPSFYEGFGLPPLEAMSCGCPTIVSKAASLPEVCGEASLYFDPHRVDEMALAIERVVLDRDLRRELVRKGYERVQLFDWKKSAERHEQIFNKRG